MSNLQMRDTGQANTVTIAISAEERERETALRERFATFWGSATGEPRAIYDTFISATPLTDDVTLEAVERNDVRGWWVRPSRAKPGQTRPNAALLYIHGGGYVQGSAKAYRGFVSQIVSRTQVPALVIDYPLAPEATLPTGPNTALAAWNWLVAQGFEQIAIVGDSAGGGLTLVTLAQIAKSASQVSPIAALVFSPWADLSFTGASMKDPAVEDPLIGYDYLQDCARKYLGSFDATDPLASPLLGDLRGLPPLLIQVGTDEKLFDDSRQYAARASQAGVPVQLEIWEGMHHVFQLDVAHLQSSRDAIDRAGRFLSDAFEQA